MNRDELVARIPLYASGALDPEEREAVAAALALHPDCQGAVESYGALDALLRRSLVREAIPAAAPAIKRQCPFCRDDLRSEEHVLCASCLTAHHKSCFAEHGGCSLMGCGGTRSVGATEPSLDLCPSCGEHTPSAAPYCSWCRAPLGGARLPRTRPAMEAPRTERRRFLAAAVLLLAGGLSIGYLFELRQNVLVRVLVAQSDARYGSRLEDSAQKTLVAIEDAQRLRYRSFTYRLVDIQGREETIPVRQYAPDFAALRDLESFREVRDDAFHYEMHLSSDRQHFYATARPKPGSRVPLRSFVVTSERPEVEVLAQPYARERTIDPETCVVSSEGRQ
jgi:hypothetical protein